MVRLVVVLCAAMFLTLMIGGQDRGQARLGLSLPPLMPPTAERARPATVPAAAVAKLVPVAAPAPAVPPPETLAVAEVPPAVPAATEVAATEAAPLRPTFTLSNVEEADIAALAEAPAPVVTTVLYVAATSVNVRQGPSTQDPVLGRLTRNEAVSLVRDAGDGWVQVRIEGDGIEGYVAARLLTDRAPAP